MHKHTHTCKKIVIKRISLYADDVHLNMCTQLQKKKKTIKTLKQI